MLLKIIKIAFIVILLLVGIAFAIPVLFKGKIVSRVKSEINKNLYAKVDFSDVDVSLFRHFPRIAVALNDLHVVGIDEFQKDTLISADKFDVALNLMSVIRGTDMKIYEVVLDSPRIHAIVNKEGKANWDITKEEEMPSDTAESKTLNFEINHYSINDAYIRYEDREGNVVSEIRNLNHEGSGDFTSDLFILQTKTSADAVSFTAGSIPYLVNSKLDVGADIQVNNKTKTYQFETDKISINNLHLATKGFIQMLNDSVYNMDISFNAPSTDLKDIISLVPAVYQNDFEKVKTSGKAVFNGFVKGTYSDNHIPSYTVNLDIKNGLFQYTDLPKPVKNINLALKAVNADGIADHTVVNISQGHFEMDNEPFDFRLFLKNPVSDMFIDAAIKGKLDLVNITQFVKLPQGTRLTGLVKADLSAKGTISSMQQQQYDELNAAGTIAVSGLQYASAEYPDGVKVNNLFMTFNPSDVSITDLDGQYKRTNFSANGTISNLLPYMLRSKTLTGKLFLKADNMNVNEWIGTSADTSAQKSSTLPFAVPANLNLSIATKVARLVYDKLEMQEVSGDLVMQDEQVEFRNLRGDALEGSMLINGLYSTKESKTKPAISINYDVKGLDVQKTFYTFNTVQKLMPVGQFLSGRLSSQLKMTGHLGENMMPDVNSLTGNGTLLLIEGFLKRFEPMEKLANLLNVNELRDFSMKNVKNYVEFYNGMVLVKPFTVKVRDIEMEIGGMHGFNQSLDYLINLKMPRALIGDKGNAFVNNMLAEANNKGIPVALGETVNFHINMGGTIKSPVFKVDFKKAAANMVDELKEQAFGVLQSKADSTKKAVTDSLFIVRRQLEKNVQDELRRRMYGNRDSIPNPENSLDSSRKRVEEAAKGLFKGFLKRKNTRDST